MYTWNIIGYFIASFWSILFYGAAITSLFFSIKYRREKNNKDSVIFLVLFTLPITLYVGQTIYLFAEKKIRPIRVASWTRVAPPKIQSIRSLTVSGSPAQLTPLIAAGVLDSIAVVGRTRKQISETYLVRKGRDCVRKIKPVGSIFRSTKFQLREAIRARNAYRLCHTAVREKSKSPAPIWLYRSRYAPSRNRACGGLISGATMELRQAPELGGELIAYEEIPYFREIAHFPRIGLPIFGKGMYAMGCTMDYAETRKYTDLLGGFNFLTRALGLIKIDDFPRVVDKSDALDSLRILNEEVAEARSDSDAARAIVLLLGQWPSNPDISRYIRSSVRRSDIRGYFAAKINGRNTDFDLLRHLKSHEADFIEVCYLTASDTQRCDSWKRKVQARS